MMDDASLSTEQKSAIPIMDSLIMCMEENNMTYEPTDPLFFWTAMSYEIGIYGHLRDADAMADNGNGMATVPVEMVEEYADMLFQDYGELLEIPADMTMVQHSADGESYDFGLGDRGTNTTKIISWTDNGDGTNTVVAGLYEMDENGEAVGEPVSYEFVLGDSPYVDTMSDPIFYYAVQSAKKL